MSLIDDVDLARQCFYDVFLRRINKHAPFRKFRVKRRKTAWFSPEIGSRLKDRDAAWSRADWLRFHQL